MNTTLEQEQIKASDMSNSMLFEYIYEKVDNINEFISRDEFKGVVEMLGVLEEIVQRHIDLKKLNPNEEL